MAQKRALYTLAEWNSAVEAGTAVEPTYSELGPTSTIECPNTNSVDDAVGDGVCRSHLFDLPATKPKYEPPVDSFRYRAVACGTCGWKGYRRIARIKHTNGKAPDSV